MGKRTLIGRENQFLIICNESSFFPDSSEMNASSAWSADFPRTKPITKRT
jgi:hypothetical protein